jgi:hypothetical protein
MELPVCACGREVFLIPIAGVMMRKIVDSETMKLSP